MFYANKTLAIEQKKKRMRIILYFRMNLSLILFLILINSFFFDDIIGQIFAIYNTTVSEAEPAVFLAIAEAEPAIRYNMLLS